MSRTARRAGFTILEILIAIVILVVGITGIVALFPTAIESGNKTVEDSYAAAITQSVIDAISVGLRESHYTIKPAGPGSDTRLYHYFILDHDGVLDSRAAYPSPQQYDGGDAMMWKKDFCILLPKGPLNAGKPNTSSALEPIFLYPVVSDQDFGFGTPWAGPADKRAKGDLSYYNNNPNGGNNSATDDMAAGSPGGNPGPAAPNGMFRNAYDNTPLFWVRRTFPLGRYREGDEVAVGAAYKRAYRKEFLGDLISGTTGGDVPENRPLIDPYPQYSFAIAITRAKIDNADTAGNPTPDGKITPQDSYSDNLYEVRILIFRNFNQEKAVHDGIFNGSRPIPKQNIPIREFVTLMSI